MADLIFVDAPHEVAPLPRADAKDAEAGGAEERRGHGHGGMRRAWLHAPPEAAAAVAAAAAAGSALPVEQWAEQSEGWEASRVVIAEALSAHAPVDGILGFSQGAAVAALAASHFHDLRFAILCSGYAPTAPPLAALLASPLPLPSLHIFGRADRQMAQAAPCEQLVELFGAEGRVVVEHTQGHIVPASNAYADRYVAFLRQFTPVDDAPAAPDDAPPPSPPPSPPPELDGGGSVEALPQRENRKRLKRAPAAEASSSAGAASSAAAEAAAPEEAPSSLPASLAADAPTQYEYLDHTADVQLHSWGATLEDAFAQQVLAMMGLMTELPTVEPSAVREVTAEGHDLHSLLFHVLDEFLFLFSTELFVARRVAVTHLDRTAFTAHAVAVGETFTLGKHPQGTEVKAITYSAMRVTEAEGRTDVLVIVDI